MICFASSSLFHNSLFLPESVQLIESCWFPSTQLDCEHNPNIFHMFNIWIVQKPNVSLYYLLEK